MNKPVSIENIPKNLQPIKKYKFVTNKTKTCLKNLFYLFVKSRPNFQMIVFISHVILSEKLWKLFSIL